MVRIRFFKFLLLLSLVLAPMATAQAACPETASGFHTYLGVDLTPWDGSDSELLRVLVVWVPPDPEIRYRDQYVIDIDWKTRTHTNVDVWDGELQAVRVRDINPVILQTNTNFETGQVHIETCSGVLDSAGPVLVFSYYGHDGKIEPAYTRVAPLLGFSAVTNSDVSQTITGTFDGLDQRMLEDVELATGVAPGHYLAQSFLFQNLSLIGPILDKNPPLFFNAKNAKVHQNRLYVTGNESSASVPLSLAAVFSNGEDILGADSRVRNLEQYIGTVQFQSRFREKWTGYNLIIEARSDLTVATQPCTDGYTNLTADFAYPSEAPGYIWLYSENLDLVALEPSINERVSCASDYRLASKKAVENITSYFPNYVIWVPVATAVGTIVKVEYFTRYTDDWLTKHEHGYDPLIASPSVETVLKVWDAPNIESLYGTRVFTCDNPGDSRVDSIDEIASRRRNLLTKKELASFDPYTDVERNNLAWTDGNGDGSICDRHETDPEGDGESITRITLAVYPAKG